MLSTFNLPGKNISPDKQLAMMRTYLSQLKDETEGELYNIRWDNLSKDLREKIDGLQSIAVQANDLAMSVKSISAAYITADYITANLIESLNIHVGTAQVDGYLAAGCIGTTQLAAGAVTAEKIEAHSIGADQIATNYVYAGTIVADTQITGTLAANHISSALLRTENLNAELINSRLSESDILIVAHRNYRPISFAYEGTNYYILAADRPY